MWKASWIILLLFLVGFGLDLYSTLRLGNFANLLEANPLYPIGGFPLIILFNILYIWILLIGYDKGSTTLRFYLVSLFMVHTYFRAFVIRNNFLVGEQIAADIITMEIAQTVSQADKVGYILSSSLNYVLIPLALILVIYFVFRLDNRVSRNE